MTVLINQQTVELNQREQAKLLNLLPYWGLSLDQDQAIGPAFDKHAINIHCSHSYLIEQTQVYLQHTGLTLMQNQQQSPMYDVQFFNNHDYPISVQAGTRNMTYNLKPLHPGNATTVQRFIHKNLWLPPGMEPYTVIIDASYQSRSAEWLAYLFMQQMSDSLLPDLKHISFPVYQYLVKKVLTPLNESFAKTQFVEQSEPDLPLSPQPKQQQAAEKPAPHKKQVSPQKGSHFGHKQTNQQTINPFKNDSDSDRGETINPFKRTHEQQTKPFNPFKKKR